MPLSGVIPPSPGAIFELEEPVNVSDVRGRVPGVARSSTARPGFLFSYRLQETLFPPGPPLPDVIIRLFMFLGLVLNFFSSDSFHPR